MFVQRVCRGWIARRKVMQMREDYSLQRVREEEEERIREEEIQERKEIESERCKNPKSKADFDMLYNRLEDWRKEQEASLQAKDSKAANLGRAKLVMNEAELLLQINKHKSSAKMDAKERMIEQFLTKAATPILKMLKSGELIEIETPETRLATAYKNMHNNLREEVVFVEDRVELLIELDSLVKDDDCKVVKELRLLIKREIDFINRSLPGSSMTGLRSRILNLYLQYIRNPEYNPQVRKFLRIEAPDLSSVTQMKKTRSRDTKKDIELCQACSRYLPKSSFNISAGSGSIAQCRGCKQLDNDARTRLDLSLYKQLLDSIKLEEEERNNTNSPAFILQESDIRYLVENIWNSRSVLSGNADLFDLRLARRECEKEWTPWNCILVSREENRIHRKLGGLNSCYPSKEDLLKAYGPLLVEIIAGKHTLARNHFGKIASMSIFVKDDNPDVIQLRGVGIQPS
ncbi:IQ and ubiquitin-like domain-containing protein [Eurytemora carolleeae]|uniref:IQ and ubiquitin-like domain-containing protein n=1 Tax=Eurytemora carolleeae TaxID=1294199 RepID=UPI000C75D6D6|nr:IQ and ubiquitin-like domain-containing protein [Eurytemora carolleeae]|eukprot:XP_023332134.1 IQ and ubiquitin-like domain-containing protein [Eurytemora affinis]